MSPPASCHGLSSLLQEMCIRDSFNAIMSFANGMGEIRYSTIVNIILLWGVRIPASYRTHL